MLNEKRKPENINQPRIDTAVKLSCGLGALYCIYDRNCFSFFISFSKELSLSEIYSNFLSLLITGKYPKSLLQVWHLIFLTCNSYPTTSDSNGSEIRNKCLQSFALINKHPKILKTYKEKT